jgi:hypothetical protein
MGARAAFGVVVVGFLASRAILHLGVTPFFDFDTYKYLGGADALWAGAELPPLFRDLQVTGGALHAVPGYAWFIAAVWALCGRVTLLGIVIAHASIAFLGFLAAADLARRWVGPWTAVGVLAVLATAPTLGWLEHLAMPDVLAAPLFWLAVWLVVAGPFGGDRGFRIAVVGAVCGLVLATEMLVRTASQFLMPLLFAVALCARRSLGAFACWSAACAVALVLGLSPWLLHNHEHHGVYRVSASTGRNVYFSLLWSSAETRETHARALGMPSGAPLGSAYAISDTTLQRLVGESRSFADADAAMMAIALEIYRAAPLGTIVRDRLATVTGLFVQGPGPGESLRPLRANLDRVLANPIYGGSRLTLAEQRFQHPFSAATRDALARARRPPGWGQTFFAWWVRGLTLEGAPLLGLFLVTLPLFALLPRAFAPTAFWSFAAPPLAFLALFAVVGAPLYRYQAGLHPFMLGSIALGIGAALTTLRGRAAPRR